MANFTTVRDLRSDALWIAGEAQTSASSYYTRSLEYLNAVLIGLISGGPLGAVTLPSIDWWWAYQTRRGQVAIPNAANLPVGSVTASLTQGSTTVTFSSAFGGPLAGYRFALVNDRDQLLYITTYAGGLTAVADLAWQKTSVTGQQWLAWKDQVALPADFVRFTTPLKIGRHPYEIQIVDMVALERSYPRGQTWVGTPVCAAIVNDASTEHLALHMSHMLQDGPIVAEFEYLFKQDELLDSTGLEVPPMPHQHRRVLSLGAAYLMLFDKVDSKFQQVGKMFMDAWEAMAEEQYRQATDNANFGRILTRPREVAANRLPLRSPSGAIYG